MALRRSTRKMRDSREWKGGGEKKKKAAGDVSGDRKMRNAKCEMGAKGLGPFRDVIGFLDIFTLFLLFLFLVVPLFLLSSHVSLNLAEGWLTELDRLTCLKSLGNFYCWDNL